MKVSLCVITGQEAAYCERFLASFAKDFDELCMVRAIGNLVHDKTVTMAKEWCRQNGKAFRFAEYRNEGWREGLAADAPIVADHPETWQHVDNFAAARNVSWGLATGDWQFWADLDDLLAPDSAGLIRDCALSGFGEYYYFNYAIKNSNQTNMRERLFKVGASRWVQPVHENCRHDHLDDAVKGKWVHDPKVIFGHEPDTAKVRDPERNIRICEYHLRFLTGFAPELEREYFWKWSEKHTPELAEKATHWAEVSHLLDILPEQKMAMLLNQADIAFTKDPEHAIDLCWSAARITPWMREPWGKLAELELAVKRFPRADFMSTLMQSMRKPPTSGMPFMRRYYEDEGFYLKTRTMRSIGRIEQADKGERDMFEKNGRRISLLHATRGRPLMALQARKNFLMGALNSFAVEHIFAIDEDDAESLNALKYYRHVVVKEPRGCVKAWNAAAAASCGHVLVQMSDDWLPCIHWDELIWLNLKDAAEKRGGTIETIPLVLAVHDNHRQDALLCMAIVTRARYEQTSEVVETGGRREISKPYLFHPDYFGVFSDNELTHRAYDDRVVVQAQHLIFDHQHPIWLGKPVEQWDETHKRQNHPDRYAEGLEIFCRRNPKHAHQYRKA